MWNNTDVFEYVQFGGNLILLSRMGQDFIDGNFANYLGINWAEDSETILDCNAVYSGLTDITFTGTQSYVDLFYTTVGSESELLFTETQLFSSDRGLGVLKTPAAGGTLRANGGRVVFLGVRPYRVNTTQLRQNVEYMLANFFPETSRC